MEKKEEEKLKIKVVCGQDIRRWHMSERKGYEELKVFVEKTFGWKRDEEYQIQYEDAEMDRITLSNEKDFEDALSCAVSENRKSLKLFVTKRNREQEELNEKEKKEQDKQSEKSEQNNNLRKMELDFLLDENIKRLLPQLVQHVIKAIRENTENEVPLLEVVQTVLTDEKYLPIVCHEFYQTIEKKMPFWLTKMSPYAKMLSNLNEDHVLAMINSAMNAITTSLATQKDEQANEQLWNPMNFLFTDGFQQRNNDPVIHHGVECDGCGLSPIRGARYKCTLCPNYDLCCNCNSSKVHDPNHPLVEILTPPAHGRRCVPGLGGAMHAGSNPHQNWHHGSFGCSQKEKKSGKRANQLKAEWIKEARDEPIVSFVNTVVEKAWTLKNVGNEEWGDDVVLVFLKGNETLVLEKRYPVSNIRPEESAQVSAAIQVPSIPGHFSACFRLQKNGEFFGPRLWVEVHAVEENNASQVENANKNENDNGNANANANNENANKNENENVNKNENENSDRNENKNENENENENETVRCICGAPMTETTTMLAYFDEVDAHCDLCGVDCPSNGPIFHCFAKDSLIHPKGYDLCLICAQCQMESFEQPQDQKNEEIVQPKEETVTAPPASDPWDGFEYANQAHEIEEMGFTDFASIKELLTSKKGNVNEVLAELLQQY